MEIESDIPKIPDFQLSEKQFLLQHTDLEEKDRQHIIEEILQAIKKDHLAPYYHYLHTEISDFLTTSLYRELASENEKVIEELKLKIKEAEDEEDTELDVASTTTKLAEYYTKIIDRKNATETFKKVLELTPNTGSKIDHLLTLTRIDFSSTICHWFKSIWNKLAN